MTNHIQQRGAAAAWVAGLAPEQKVEAISVLLAEVEAGQLAEIIAETLRPEALAPMLLPHLLDTEGVMRAMTEEARKQGVAREYGQAAVLQRVARGYLQTTGVMINRGHTYWSWEVERMLRGLNAKVGRPPAQVQK